MTMGGDSSDRCRREASPNPAPRERGAVSSLLHEGDAVRITEKKVAAIHLMIMVCSLLSLELMSGASTGMDQSAVAKEATLENASTQVVLRDGRIVSLLDKTRSVQHVSPEADPDRGLFRIQLVEGVKPAGEVDATQMTSQVLPPRGGRRGDRVRASQGHRSCAGPFERIARRNTLVDGRRAEGCGLGSRAGDVSRRCDATVDAGAKRNDTCSRCSRGGFHR